MRRRGLSGDSGREGLEGGVEGFGIDDAVRVELDELCSSGHAVLISGGETPYR